MFSGGLFSVGLAGPLLLLSLGFLVFGFLFAIIAIGVRLRADIELTSGESQRKIDLAIALLVISGVLPILGGVLSRYGSFGLGMILASVGVFILWPVSASLAVRGRGAGRAALLMGHGLIALCAVVLILSVVIHEFSRG